MAKGKITIELDDGIPRCMEFDDMSVHMEQTIYRFYKKGELRPSNMASDGEIRITISGINSKGRENFDALSAESYVVERAN